MFHGRIDTKGTPPPLGIQIGKSKFDLNIVALRIGCRNI